MKLSVKINLLFTAIVSGIVLVIAVIIYNISDQNIQKDFRKRLQTRAARTVYQYNLFRNDTTNLLKSLDSTSPAALVNKNINIYDKNGIIFYEYHDEGTSLINVDKDLFDQLETDSILFFTYGKKDVCLMEAASGGISYAVLAAAENVTGREYISNLKKLFLVYLPVALLVTILAGYLFAKSLVKPINQTIRDVQLITSQNLSHRLYVGNKRDEFSQLNATFNDLLNRLEESFAIQRRFISNASHELSTPLTSVSSQIEVALLHNRSDEEYRRVLGSVLEDIQELHQLTKTLLEIANAGTHGAISLDKVRIDEVLLKAHSETLRQHTGYSVSLEFNELPEDENECLVFGNVHLLQSAFRNIMENGCKYSPDRSVNVQLFFKADKAEIRFVNKGDIIPEDEMNRLFEPFYRGGNAEGKPGVGLGLTLTKRIINLHKGTLSIASEPEQGTIFKIILPTMLR